MTIKMCVVGSTFVKQAPPTKRGQPLRLTSLSFFYLAVEFIDKLCYNVDVKRIRSQDNGR